MPLLDIEWSSRSVTSNARCTAVQSDRFSGRPVWLPRAKLRDAAKVRFAAKKRKSGQVEQNRLSEL
jgi:hypothetical protein